MLETVLSTKTVVPTKDPGLCRKLWGLIINQIKTNIGYEGVKLDEYFRTFSVFHER